MLGCFVASRWDLSGGLTIWLGLGVQTSFSATHGTKHNPRRSLVSFHLLLQDPRKQQRVICAVASFNLHWFSVYVLKTFNKLVVSICLFLGVLHPFSTDSSSSLPHHCLLFVRLARSNSTCLSVYPFVQHWASEKSMCSRQ